MLKYLLGYFLNLFNRGVSLFCLIDSCSKVNCKARVYGFTRIFNSTIDKYSYVGSNTMIIYADISRFCSIAGDSIIGMSIHTLDNLSTSPIFTEKHNGTGSTWTNTSNVYPYEKVQIGNDVWIGARVMIMGGITIGNGAVIGAGAIVTKDVPPYAIVAGIPAKVIRYRFSQEVIDRLETIKWWNFPDQVLKDNITLFQSKEVDIDAIERIANTCL